MRKIFFSAIVITGLFLFFATPALAQTAGCTIGISNVACPGTTRTLLVAQSGTANYRSISSALYGAQPGDTIVVRAGTYEETIDITRSGTATAPITLVAYAGERPIIRTPGTSSWQRLTISGSWIIFDGFEVTNGWHGIVITGSHNVVKNNYIHNNGDSCAQLDVCGQGIIVASASNVALQNNIVERNGLLNPHSWNVHGIYISDYWKRGISNVTLTGNLIRHHAGAGIHGWDSTVMTGRVQVQNNWIENNVFEAVLANAENWTFTGNAFVHTAHPTSNAPRTGVLWFESTRGITFDGNLMQYGIASNDPLPAVLIWKNQQDWRQIVWARNTWQLPANYPAIDDSYVTNAGLAP